MTGSRRWLEIPADAGSNAEYPLKLPPGAPSQQRRVRDFRRVVVVTGTPGVGKSKFSKLLAKRIGAFHVNVGEVALTEGFTLGTDLRRRSKIADLDRILRWVRNLIDEVDRDLVVEGHYAPIVVPKRHVRLAIVLRCDPNQLVKRLRMRRLARSKVYENVAAEILDVCLVDAVRSYGRKKVCEIDTTGRTFSSILTEALNVVEGRYKPSLGKVDWLSKSEERGQLEKLMSFKKSNLARRI